MPKLQEFDALLQLFLAIATFFILIAILTHILSQKLQVRFPFS